MCQGIYVQQSSPRVRVAQARDIGMLKCPFAKCQVPSAKCLNHDRYSCFIYPLFSRTTTSSIPHIPRLLYQRSLYSTMVLYKWKKFYKVSRLRTTRRAKPGQARPHVTISSLYIPVESSLSFSILLYLQILVFRATNGYGFGTDQSWTCISLELTCQRMVTRDVQQSIYTCGEFSLPFFPSLSLDSCILVYQFYPSYPEACNAFVQLLELTEAVTLLLNKFYQKGLVAL